MAIEWNGPTILFCILGPLTLLVSATLLTLFVLPTLYARYGRKETDVPPREERHDTPPSDPVEAPL